MEMNIFRRIKKLILAVTTIAILILLVLACGKEEAEEELPVAEDFGPVLNLGEMVINLADEGQARYAKMAVVLEFDGDKGLEEANKREPQIRDIVIELLGGEKAISILSLEDRNDLKKRIRERINSEMSDGRVETVYFTTVIVQ